MAKYIPDRYPGLIDDDPRRETLKGLQCPSCGGKKIKTDGEWDQDSGEQTAHWFECLDCEECFG